MRTTPLSLVAVVLTAATYWMPAHAAKTANPLASDERIQQVPYDPNQVYEVSGTYGYQTSIEFGRDEVIKVVSLGDSIAWQTVPYQNRLFIKPVEPKAETNMTVISDKRAYYFRLSSTKADAPNMAFLVRFVYPAQGGEIVSRSRPVSASQPSAPMNLDYLASGDRQTIALTRVFDDGQFTYFSFAAGSEIPSIYTVGGDGTESVISPRREGNYWVAERTAHAFTLRNGQAYLCVRNNALAPVSARSGI